jgi:hypothetical protein
LHDEALTWRGSRASAIARDSSGFALATGIVLAGLLLRARADKLALFSAGTAAGSAAIALLLNVLFAVPYPQDRTGLYFVPLTLLALATLTRAAPRRPQVSRMGIRRRHSRNRRAHRRPSPIRPARFGGRRRILGPRAEP